MKRSKQVTFLVFIAIVAAVLIYIDGGVFMRDFSRIMTSLHTVIKQDTLSLIAIGTATVVGMWAQHG